MTLAPQEITVGDRVRVLSGELPGVSEFRPYDECRGVVTKIWSGIRYSIHVRFDSGKWCVFHHGELEVIQDKKGTRDRH